MTDDARAVLAAVQTELRRLDDNLAEADGSADALAVATVLVDLTKMRAKLVKLAGSIKPPPDPGPTLPGFGDDDQGGGESKGKKR